MEQRRKHGVCLLCRRRTHLTFHHLIPKKLHRRTHFQRHFSREELGQGIDICRKCHSGIHGHYDEMRLAREFCTLKQIVADPQLAKHFAWVSRQKVK